MNANVFPKDACPFPLRRDFIDEIGYSDKVRDLRVSGAVAQRRREELQLTDDSEAQLHEWHRSLYDPPQFLCFFTGVEPRVSRQARYIWDGTTIVPVEEDGAIALWMHMLFRLSTLVKGGPELVDSIAATKLPFKASAWGIPACAIVHDRHAGMAAVLPWERSMQYLKLNPK